ncbi:MAG: acetyltransferase, partial [Bacteroidetes bacterium]
PIVIRNDVWLASGVTVLSGVEIGQGAVVAANSVVNKSIPAYEIWGGTPARKIGERE